MVRPSWPIYSTKGSLWSTGTSAHMGAIDRALIGCSLFRLRRLRSLIYNIARGKLWLSQLTSRQNKILFWLEIFNFTWECNLRPKISGDVLIEKTQCIYYTTGTHTCQSCKNTLMYLAFSSIENTILPLNGGGTRQTSSIVKTTPSCVLVYRILGRALCQQRANKSPSVGYLSLTSTDSSPILHSHLDIRLQ